MKKVKVIKKSSHQLYGFTIILTSVVLFVLLQVLPYFKIATNCKDLQLKIGGESYPFPIILLAVGIIELLNIGPAIAKRIGGK